MYHLFYKDKDIIFTDNNLENTENNVIFAPTLTIDEVLLLLNNSNLLCVVSDGPKASFELFLSQFKRIEAAGGVVISADGELLMIKRNGVWDLPKGKREKGENIAECAVREVEEECGIDSLECGELRCVTNHIYKLHGEWIVKPTYWYNMLYGGKSKSLTPQIEEGIELVEWVEATDIKSKIRESFSTIKYVLSN